MARPKIEIDLAQVEDLAAKGLTQKQICQSVGISEDTLQRRKRDSAVFAASMERGKVRGRVEVANRLFEACKRGNVAAIIWYEKTRCGRAEPVEHRGPNGGPIQISEPIKHLTDAQLRAIVALAEKQSNPQQDTAPNHRACLE